MVKFSREKRARDPAIVPFYASKRQQDRVVSRGFNALSISERQRFALKAYGKPFNYQGILTKRYELPTLEKLFFVRTKTIHNWVTKGWLPEPMLRLSLGNKRIWFYHQIQPFYVWYWHIRNKQSILHTISEADVKVLRRMQRYAEMRWYKMIGVEYPDPYRTVAGKYGVIYQNDGVK